MNKKFIPYNSQFIDEEDIAAVADALRSPYLTTGPLADEFEEKLSDYLGVKYAVLCANGTAALHLSMMSLNIGKGDSVITSPITFVADANAPRFCGADVIFADIDPETINLDPNKVRKILENNKSVKAIIPVHFAGQAADMESFSALAKEFNVHIIEDGCHALGGGYVKQGKEVKVGSCSDSKMTTFSFHPIKSITTGEGGAITTNDESLYRKLKILRSHGNTKDPSEVVYKDLAFSKTNQGEIFNPWYYELQHLSFNYRLTDFQSALGMSQLSKLDMFIEKRNSLSKHYDKVISSLGDSRIEPLKTVQGKNHARHLYVIKIPMKHLDGGRAGLMNELLQAGIQTQVHYIPINWQPYYQEYFKEKVSFPEAESYYLDCLSLPLHVPMSNEDVERVIEEISLILNKLWMD
jgi:UDP-4-amino-4,6-dideoxy-N-acetyl-beta-L-altrosamine transaminase